MPSGAPAAHRRSTSPASAVPGSLPTAWRSARAPARRWPRAADAAPEKHGNFKRTDADPMRRVPQGSKHAEKLKKLKKLVTQIRLPEGFKIVLLALVPDARSMAVSLNKAAVWVGTRKSTVWSVTDRNLDNVADTVEQFSPSIKLGAR